MTVQTKPFHPEQLPEAVKAIEELLDPLDKWSHQCHAASLKIVKSGILAESRVARGMASGVGSQHSWVVFGMDCYDTRATIIDPTLWSYRDDVDGIWVGSLADEMHTPHGTGNIFDWGRPDYPTEETIALKEPEGGWSDRARLFLDILGPLDETGWRRLCGAPVSDWTAGEIFGAICDTFDWGEAVIPIDILGMTTLRDPGGLYLGGEDED